MDIPTEYQPDPARPIVDVPDQYQPDPLWPAAVTSGLDPALVRGASALELRHLALIVRAIDDCRAGREHGGFVTALVAGDFGRAYDRADAINARFFGALVEYALHPRPPVTRTADLSDGDLP